MTINSSKVLRIYKSLDKDQIQFVLDKKIEDTLTLEEWLTKLHGIAEMDTIGDESRKQAGNLSIVFGILTIATIILTISKPILFFFPIGFLILFIYFVVTYFLLSKIDIGNNMRLFIVPMLEYFSKQGSVKKAFSLRMDFSHPITKERLSKADDEENQKTDSIYRHHWMDGNIMFNDGVKITWEIEDVISKRDGNLKRGGNKKDPTGKYEIQHILNMHFSAPKEHFIAINKDMMETDDGLYYIVSIHKKDISDSFDEGMSPEVFISSIEEGYHFVRLK
jgi:hypothetical protein